MSKNSKPAQAPKPNDHRSDVKNPNNPAEKADRDNRSVQKNVPKPKK